MPPPGKQKEALLQVVTGLANEGYRVLGVAKASFDKLGFQTASMNFDLNL